MARPQTPPISAQMRHARSYTEQSAALRQLKNDVVGQDQNKERWVQDGILDTIVKLLRAARLATNSPPDAKNGQDVNELLAKGLADHEEVRLQALQLLSIFARGGPAFLFPIYKSGAVPAIIENIFPLDNPPRVVEVALGTLFSICYAANRSDRSKDNDALDICVLTDQVFRPFSVGALHSTLQNRGATRSEIEQRNYVLALIADLPLEDVHRTRLADYGILDDLAYLLAAHVVARGEVVPGAAEQGKPHGLDELIPDPAPPGEELHSILDAIAAIIGNSKFRACLFMNSPVLLAVFPYVDFHPLARTPLVLARDALEMSGLAPIRWRLGAMDYLLPAVPVSQHQHHKPSSSSTPFPNLGSSRSRQASTPSGNGKVDSRSTSRFSFMETGYLGLRPAKSPSLHTDPELDDAESPLIPWLIHLFRTAAPERDRISTASALACLVKAGFANAEREAQIGQIVVPRLCTYLNEATELGDEPHEISLTLVQADDDEVIETYDKVPAILARLISSSEVLQKAAYENGVIKTASTLLTSVSYTAEGHNDHCKPWSPLPNTTSTEDDHATRLGDTGLSQDRAFRVNLREGVLGLMAVMAALKDEYRKAFDERDTIGWVVSSLSPCPSRPTKSKEKPKPLTDDAAAIWEMDSIYTNNPKSVIIAACHVVRLLSRSVSLLRTSLWDYGAGDPLFRLLRHGDTDIQRAACSAICNLITETSPSREFLVESGIVKVLCELAHSHDAGLRHEAMWSLRSLVKEAPPEMKRQCLDDLEPGWLVRLICVDTEDDALFARRSQEKKQQQSHDGDADDSDEYMDSSETPAQKEEQHNTTSSSSEDHQWEWGGLSRICQSPTPASKARSLSPKLSSIEAKLRALREAENDPVRKARSDDLAVQEQALGFIQNLLYLSTERAEDQTDMVDYLFGQLGQDRLFEILTSKLNTRVLHPFSRRASESGSGRESRVVYPQARVIEHVVYILVHIAASIPRHRQLVVAQTELLRQVGQHFNSKHPGVRVAVCQLLTNLVWKDDQSDTEACQQRKAELKRLGFESKLQGMVTEDAELNVREKARIAAWELKQ